MFNLTPGVHVWWKVARKYPKSLRACTLMVKMLVGEEPLNWNLGRYEKPQSMQNRVCKICNTGQFETIRHFLYECSELEEAKQPFVSSLIEFSEQGQEIVRQCDIKLVVSAHVNVGNNYMWKLATLADKVFLMFSKRQSILEAK